MGMDSRGAHVEGSEESKTGGKDSRAVAVELNPGIEVSGESLVSELGPCQHQFRSLLTSVKSLLVAVGLPFALFYQCDKEYISVAGKSGAARPAKKHTFRGDKL
ncbi:hypothetical protein BHE74_00025649 [Ensete ventricosum]|nr:hypothetical protein BHE74_00025649 [Ensete ventricosum]